MQLLRSENNSGAGAIDAMNVAQEVLDSAPPLVRVIRRMMRGHRLQELSVPQFRAMALLNYSPHASLSCVADFVGSSLPAASRMIDGLVAKKLVLRQEASADRRQVALALTARGRTALNEAREATRRQLSEKLLGLTQAQRSCVVEAMQILGRIFGRDISQPGQEVGRKIDLSRSNGAKPGGIDHGPPALRGNAAGPEAARRRRRT